MWENKKEKCIYTNFKAKNVWLNREGLGACALIYILGREKLNDSFLALKTILPPGSKVHAKL